MTVCVVITALPDGSAAGVARFVDRPPKRSTRFIVSTAQPGNEAHD